VIRLSFLAMALVVVPGALLCACAYLILKGRNRCKADRVAEEQAKFLPRNPARDDAKADLLRAEHDRITEERERRFMAGTEGPPCPRCGMCAPCVPGCPVDALGGTDEPSAPEDQYVIGADPAIGPGRTYSFWSPPKDKADEFAQRFWSGLGETFTASNGTTSTTLASAPNDEGEVSDAEWDEIMAKLPAGYCPVSVGPRLCAVSPDRSLPVVRWSRATNAWLGGVDVVTATAARAALGASS
jgi:ferredoxin